MINGNRVRQAREFCGLTQSVLADLVQVNQSAVAYIEIGRLEPSSELVSKIALQTGFPPAFFSQGDPPSLPEGSLLFRARTAMTSSVRSQALRYGEVLFEIVERMAARLRVITPRIPQLADEPADIVAAARFTRNAMGVSPNVPISNLLVAAERAGILVLAAPLGYPELDAFSAWAGSSTRRPIIVLFGDPPGDRLRLTVAHELGHLVLHQALHGSWHAFDAEAYHFAAELLLPEDAMREEMIPPVTLSGITELKARWGVSIQALIRRAHDLQIISERQYRYLFEQLTIKGWRLEEPIEVPRERPRAVRKMAELLYSTPDKKSIDYQRMGADMCLSPARLRQIIERQASRAGVVVTNSQDDPERENTAPIQFPQRFAR